MGIIDKIIVSINVSAQSKNMSKQQKGEMTRDDVNTNSSLKVMWLSN